MTLTTDERTRMLDHLCERHLRFRPSLELFTDGELYAAYRTTKHGSHCSWPT